MAFYPSNNTTEYWFMIEKIAPIRSLHLMDLAQINHSGVGKELTIALRDLENDKWTKWEGLFHNKFNLTTALDIHRSMLWNEIVIESDYPTYEENYDASRIMGAILEDKGFKPLYYYSGNKSIHIHIYIDFKSLFTLKEELRQAVINTHTQNEFIKGFMLFIRLKAARYWDIKARISDEQVAGSDRHLIRSELSLHKKGFKTFIGYTYKDLSWIPPIHNFETKTVPVLGDIVLSTPNDMALLVEEYLKSKELAQKKKNKTLKTRSLSNWIDGGPQEAGDIRKCVKLILTPDNRIKTDGYNRGFFILFNELKKIYDADKARNIIEAWNINLGEPIRPGDIEYRTTTPTYNLSCTHIHSFLSSCGYEEKEYAH